MTTSYPIPGDRAGQPQIEGTRESRRDRKRSTDIPRIKLFSPRGFEAILWGIVIAHIVKWVGNSLYYIFWQTRETTGSAVGRKPVYTWDNKRFWDNLPVHVQNGFRWIIAVAIGLAVLALVLFLTRRVREPATQVFRAAIACILGAGAGLAASFELASYRVHWFATQATPIWWFTWRHDIRDVGISMFATIVVLFMFQKPKYPLDDAPSLRVYLTSIPKGLAAALVPIGLIGVLAWQLPWVLRHGWEVPSSFGALASEINGFIAAGTWITVLMGILGGIVAKRFIARIADDVQWFVAERSAAKIRAKQQGDRTGLAGSLDTAFSGTVLRSDRIIGTPAHRARVQWILASRPELPDRNLWVTRALTAAAVAVLPLAAFGAWLTLVGPAAVH
jgi:hypothetical protein